LAVVFSTPSPSAVCEAGAVSLDYVPGSIVAIGLLVYLVYALVRRERF
jgi:K+-transporting ATPase KdpF subunit